MPRGGVAHLREGPDTDGHVGHPLCDPGPPHPPPGRRAGRLAPRRRRTGPALHPRRRRSPSWRRPQCQRHLCPPAPRESGGKRALVRDGLGEVLGDTCPWNREGIAHHCSRHCLGVQSSMTRLATSVCRLRHDRMEQDPTEPHAGRSTFLLSSGGAGGGYDCGLWYGADSY